MSETPTQSPPATGLVGLVERVSLWLAVIGGLTLIALVMLTTISIIGRALIPLGLSAISGDFELVEAGTAFAVFCFLPWCQLRGGHVTVDVLSGWLTQKSDTFLALLWNLTMVLLSGFIAWRLWVGMNDKMRYGETSMILQFPTWAAFAACVAPAIMMVAAALVSLYRNGRDLCHDRPGPAA